MKVQIHISLKNGVLDPQGKAIENSLINLGFDKIENVRQGKFIELDIDCLLYTSDAADDA